ncbi:hypothetical protein AcW1_007428 [Taiwanofungus camphoratus]|nr:hypothetical protein AcW2_007512 [Antrodia cinnamomea]KAI0947112.1 hypothetical protein AcV7_009629 [Antrodia cinnamomea]KAI0953118.1 hypothetical protein AcW1_007428 [Antrodia cinnamomea]
MQGMFSKQKYTLEEKKQLLANLDLEVDHRTRQLEEWLADALENFRRHQEGLISRMPRLVRDITMREFAKYNGNVQECVKGLKRNILGADDNTIDKGTRKRKWVASQDATDKSEDKTGPSNAAQEAESSRRVKSARTMIATPKKKPGLSTGLGTTQRARFPLPKTPGTSRTLQRIPSGAMSPSPHKGSSMKTPLFLRPPSRPASPSKLASPSKPLHPNPSSRHVRPPSSSFNPTIPASQLRWPRKDESMLSLNGSPLANPYQLGLNGWMKTMAEGGGGDETESDGSENEVGKNIVGGRILHKKNSITIRSSSQPSGAPNGSHSRTNSQASIIATPHATHSRSNSHNNTNTSGFIPTRSNHQPNQVSAPDRTPMKTSPSLTALVAVPTKDGHVLEFDPFKTSPEEIDALEGIMDSAKKQAKEDMTRLIQVAVERWKIS